MGGLEEARQAAEAEILRRSRVMDGDHSDDDAENGERPAAPEGTTG